MEIKIHEVKQEIGKDSRNPYWRLKTDKGNMSCFDKEIADKLFEYWQKNVICYVDAQPSKDGKYVNIRRLMTFEENEAYEEANKNYEATRDPAHGHNGFIKPVEVVKPIIMDEMTTVSTEPNYNPTSMYVSYAKDIFCSLAENYKGTPELKGNEMMNHAINLVKQAHDAFS